MNNTLAMTHKTRRTLYVAIMYVIGALWMLCAIGLLAVCVYASMTNPAMMHLGLLALIPGAIGLVFIGHADDVAQDLA